MYTNKQIWSVSYPILLSLLAQNVINVTDTAFLGHVSEVALGASAMGGLFYICVFTIAFGFSTGSQIVIARRNGEGRYSDVGPVMIQGIMFLFVMALLLFGFTKAFGGNIMRLLVSSESIYEGTMEFLDWRIYGFFFSFINVMFRALYIGITRTNHQCHCHGINQCRTRLCINLRKVRFAGNGYQRGCYCFRIGRSLLHSLFRHLYVCHGRFKEIRYEPPAHIRPCIADADS